MKPLFIKKNGTVSKVSGVIMNLIPSYTLAEYNALTHKPLLWVRTDEDYAQIPSEDVSYGSGSVKDALDGLTKIKTYSFSATLGTNGTCAIPNPPADLHFVIGLIYSSAGYGYFAVGTRVNTNPAIIMFNSDLTPTTGTYDFTIAYI